MVMCTCIPSLRPLLVLVLPAAVRAIPSRLVSLASFRSLTSRATAPSQKRRLPGRSTDEGSDSEKSFPLESVAGCKEDDRSLGTADGSIRRSEDSKWLDCPRPRSDGVHSAV